MRGGEESSKLTLVIHFRIHEHGLYFKFPRRTPYINIMSV